MRIPDGYRLLKDGEKIQIGDLYFGSKLLDGEELFQAYPGPIYDQQQYIPIFRKKETK